MSAERRLDAEPDLDLLAEYAEGLLDDTAEGAVIRQLISTDAHWSRTYADLTDALASVRYDLSTAGYFEPVGPIPIGVSDRIDAVLDELAQETADSVGETRGSTAARSASRRRAAAPEVSPRRAGSSTRATGSSRSTRTSRTAPPTRAGEAARSRRQVTGGRHAVASRSSGRRRFTAAITVAAAVVVALVFGSSIVSDMFGEGTVPATTRQPNAEGSPTTLKPSSPIVVSPQPLPAQLGNTKVMSTGSDFAPAGLPRAARSGGMTIRGEDPDRPKVTPPAAPVPSELARLTRPGALATCLASVEKLAGARAISADFARYAGAPALIIVVSQGPSTPPQVIAVSPDCGVSGAHQVARATGTP